MALPSSKFNIELLEAIITSAFICIEGEQNRRNYPALRGTSICYQYIRWVFSEKDILGLIALELQIQSDYVFFSQADVVENC